ncbi:MAG: hypothetical protein U5Q44_10500 [Dehalococcoidia bacterium]|nr:hypothetical protein [Dehalococcoidia bacterium]
MRPPEDVATQPYPEENYRRALRIRRRVFAVEQPDGTYKFYFDVLNPQGVSAMAWSVILDETLSASRSKTWPPPTRKRCSRSLARRSPWAKARASWASWTTCQSYARRAIAEKRRAEGVAGRPRPGMPAALECRREESPAKSSAPHQLSRLYA